MSDSHVLMEIKCYVSEMDCFISWTSIVHAMLSTCVDAPITICREVITYLSDIPLPGRKRPGRLSRCCTPYHMGKLALACLLTCVGAAFVATP